ncbi:hypothetical protein CPC08DRAFT_724294 [Agrocybe pediades]|nr:hypothetical protein CPC08DRAFT_724294 [Agrocybe pediades]
MVATHGSPRGAVEQAGDLGWLDGILNLRGNMGSAEGEQVGFGVASARGCGSLFPNDAGLSSRMTPVLIACYFLGDAQLGLYEHWVDAGDSLPTAARPIALLPSHQNIESRNPGVYPVTESKRLLGNRPRSVERMLYEYQFLATPMPIAARSSSLLDLIIATTQFLLVVFSNLQ